MRFELPLALGILSLASSVSATKVQWAPARHCSSAQLVTFDVPEKGKCYQLPGGIQSMQVKADGGDTVQLFSKGDCTPADFPEDEVYDGSDTCLESPGYAAVKRV